MIRRELRSKVKITDNSLQKCTFTAEAYTDRWFADEFYLVPFVDVLQFQSQDQLLCLYHVLLELVPPDVTWRRPAARPRTARTQEISSD